MSMIVRKNEQNQAHIWWWTRDVPTATKPEDRIHWVRPLEDPEVVLWEELELSREAVRTLLGEINYLSDRILDLREEMGKMHDEQAQD